MQKQYQSPTYDGQSFCVVGRYRPETLPVPQLMRSLCMKGFYLRWIKYVTLLTPPFLVQDTLHGTARNCTECFIRYSTCATQLCAFNTAARRYRH